MSGPEGRIEDVVLVGAGPAGVAAAVQLVRHGLTPLVFERALVGGMVWNARLIENYPGFPDGIEGPEMARLLGEGLERADVRILIENVESIDRENGAFLVETRERRVASRTVVVASGTRPLKADGFELPGEPPTRAEEPPFAAAGRILREIHPLRDVSGARIVVVGAGDAAYDYALNLAARNRVTILSRSEAPACLPRLSEEAEASEAVDVRPNTRLVSAGHEGEGSLSLSCATGERGFRLSADYLVIAIGREPADGFLSQRLRGNSERLETAGELVFAGDVRSGSFRQTAIAAGQGVKAAMVIARRLGGAERCA